MFTPRHTTHDTTRLRDGLGLTPPDAWRTIEMCLRSRDR
jgi:hypothetical protein